MRRKKHRNKREDVELNLAAMLDMAFQLLTFFILTFKPAPIEKEVLLRMPPPQPIVTARAKVKAGEDVKNKDPVIGLNTLVISVAANREQGPNLGKILTMRINEDTPFGDNLPVLDDHLKKILRDPNNPFDQVILHVSPGLRYDALMSVIDVCTRQKMANNEPLTKLSFVEFPDGT